MQESTTKAVSHYCVINSNNFRKTTSQCKNNSEVQFQLIKRDGVNVIHWLVTSIFTWNSYTKLMVSTTIIVSIVNIFVKMITTLWYHLPPNISPSVILPNFIHICTTVSGPEAR